MSGDPDQGQDKKKGYLYIGFCVVASYGIIPVAPVFWKYLEPYFEGQYVFLFVLVLGSAIGLGAMRQRRSFPRIFILFALQFLLVFYQTGVLRKIHIFQYCLVGIMISREYWRTSSRNWMLILLLGVVGSLDEIIQYVIPRRGFEWLDVAANLYGIYSGLIINYYLK